MENNSVLSPSSKCHRYFVARIAVVFVTGPGIVGFKVVCLVEIMIFFWLIWIIKSSKFSNETDKRAHHGNSTMGHLKHSLYVCQSYLLLGELVNLLCFAVKR